MKALPLKTLAGRVAQGLDRIGLLRLLEGLDRGSDRVRILAYHRIDEPGAEPDLDPGLVSATPAAFAEQMELIARRYDAIPIERLLEAHRDERPLPRRAVLLTFDDGYRDFAENAWPILRRLGLPAVLFVPTAFPDQPGPGFWWDRLHAALSRSKARQIELEGLGPFDLREATGRRAAHRAIRAHLKSLPHDEAMDWLAAWIEPLAEVPSLHRVLGWDALRGLAREGLAVCSHGHEHALCTRLSPDALARDLTTARARLSRELGSDAGPPVFAYPASASDETSRRAVEAAGYALGLGGGREIARLPFDDPRDIGRLPVLQYPTALFRAQLRPIVSDVGSRLVDGGTPRRK